MASFHGKIGWKRLRKRENKIIIPFLSCPTRNRKLQKNRKKFKNTIIASFQAKIYWKRQKKRKNELNPSVSFLPNPK